MPIDEVLGNDALRGALDALAEGHCKDIGGIAKAQATIRFVISSLEDVHRQLSDYRQLAEVHVHVHIAACPNGKRARTHNVFNRHWMTLAHETVMSGSVRSGSATPMCGWREDRPRAASGIRASCPMPRPGWVPPWR